jgi:apolipoprotein N-acyltransferase
VTQPERPGTPPGPFVWLGYAGLIPPLALLAMLVLHRGTLAAPMLVAVAIGYAALIFSFLGGTWWGMLAGSGRRVGLASAALSVMPSLIALVLVFATARAPVVARSPWPASSPCRRSLTVNWPATAWCRAGGCRSGWCCRSAWPG